MIMMMMMMRRRMVRNADDDITEDDAGSDGEYGDAVDGDDESSLTKSFAP